MGAGTIKTAHVMQFFDAGHITPSKPPGFSCTRRPTHRSNGTSKEDKGLHCSVWLRSKKDRLDLEEVCSVAKVATQTPKTTADAHVIDPKNWRRENGKCQVRDDEGLG